MWRGHGGNIKCREGLNEGGSGDTLETAKIAAIRYGRRQGFADIICIGRV